MITTLTRMPAEQWNMLAFLRRRDAPVEAGPLAKLHNAAGEDVYELASAGMLICSHHAVVCGITKADLRDNTWQHLAVKLTTRGREVGSRVVHLAGLLHLVCQRGARGIAVRAYKLVSATGVDDATELEALGLLQASVADVGDMTLAKAMEQAADDAMIRCTTLGRGYTAAN